MNGDSGFDLASLVAKLGIGLVLVVVVIRFIIPMLFLALLTVAPGVLLLIFIGAVLRAMVKKLLG